MIKPVKGLLIALFISSLATLAVAKPVPQHSLDKVNETIKTITDEENESVIFKITYADIEGEKIQQIRFTGTEAADGSDPSVSVSADFKLEGNSVDAESSIKVMMHNDLSDKDVSELMEIAYSILSSINSEGIYEATMEVKTIKGGPIDAILKLKPLSEKAKSIKFIRVHAFIPRKQGEWINLTAKGAFNTESELVNEASQSLYKVFQALLESRLPTPEESAGFENLIETIMEYVLGPMIM